MFNIEIISMYPELNNADDFSEVASELFSFKEFKELMATDDLIKLRSQNDDLSHLYFKPQSHQMFVQRLCSPFGKIGRAHV